MATNPTKTNLIAWWELNEASGNALDSHGSNNLAETAGTIASASGKVGNARDFEKGDTEHFELADNTDLSTGDIDYCFAGWVWLESEPGTNMIILSKRDAGSNREYNLRWDTATQLFHLIVSDAAGTADIGSVTASTFGATATGTWYFVYAYHSATDNEVGISVNAGTIDTSATSGAAGDQTATFRLGATNSTEQEWWDGLLDEWLMYKKLLSQDEIDWVHNSGSGRAYGELTTAITSTLATTGAMTAAASLNAYPTYSSRAARRAFHTTALQDNELRDVYVVERETTMLPGESYDMELIWSGATAASSASSKVFYGNQDVSATVLSGSNTAGIVQTSKTLAIPQTGYWERTLVLEWTQTVDGAVQYRWLRIYVPPPMGARPHHRFVDEFETVMIPGEATNLVLLMNGVSNIDTPTTSVFDGTQDVSASFLTGNADASQNVITGKLLTIPSSGYDGKTVVYEWGGSADSTTQKRWLRVRIARVPR